MVQNRPALPLFVAMGLVALVSLFAVLQRHRVEASNRSVALAVEYEPVENLAAAQGVSVDVALANLKAQGVGMISLSEETVANLVTQGQATIISRSGDSVATSIQFTNEAAAERVRRGLEIRLGNSSPNAASDGSIFISGWSPSIVRTTPIGLDPAQVAAAQRAGMLILARYGNPPGISNEGIRKTLAWAKEQGAFAFLPLGDQVLGRKEGLKEASLSLQDLGLLYASPEFTRIGGDANMVADAPGNVVRLHTAQVAELDKVSTTTAIERFGKAARERNMRILLLRPTTYGAEKPLGSLATFAKSITDMIRRQGGDVGTPRPFPDPGVPRLVFVLIGLGVAGVAWLILYRFIEDQRLLVLAGFAVPLVGLACLTTKGSQIAALLAALVFPVAAFVVIERWRPRHALLGLVAASMISLVGGLAVAGLMSTQRHLVKADEFAGVKLAVFLPILIVGAFFFWRLSDWRANLRSAVTWGASALTLSIVVVLALLIARTGNDSGVGASGLELKLRNLLDAALYVRPRTKEFLFGHPMLVLGLFMLHRYGNRSNRMAGWTCLALMLGAIGQTDIVNTLSHGHIPVLLSVVRVLVGLIVGSILGWFVWWAAKRLLPETREEAPLAD